MSELKDMLRTPVRDIARQPATSFAPGVPLLEVIGRMKEDNQGAILIVDEDGSLSGIFTENDAMLRIDHESDAWKTQTVGSLMTRAPQTIATSATVGDALKAMDGGRFRHLPLYDDEELVGVLSIRAIVAHIAECFPKEFLNLPPRPR